MSNKDPSSQDLHKTPLHARHVERSGKMVPFAGYDMPVQYADGIMAEHMWTRQSAGLFDVSHMGQAFLVGPNHQTTSAAIEDLVPGEILGLKPGRLRYTQLLNDQAGIEDDLMVTRSVSEEDDGRLYLVVNAGNKDADYAHIRQNLPDNVRLESIEDRALIAIQGPEAATVMARHCPDAAGLAFMAGASATFDGIDIHISRSGYTGEDGYEISIAADKAVTLWDTLLGEEEVKPVGLGARDSLRLEAGLCLHGHDIDAATTPVEADLVWSISKRRRAEGGFPGDTIVQNQIANGPNRKRVGIKPDGRAPAREGTAIHDADGNEIGTVTSGGFGPSVGGPVAMGYVAVDHAAPDTQINLMVRGKALSAHVVSLPFVKQNYYRAK